LFTDEVPFGTRRCTDQHNSDDIRTNVFYLNTDYFSLLNDMHTREDTKVGILLLGLKSLYAHVHPAVHHSLKLIRKGKKR